MIPPTSMYPSVTEEIRPYRAARSCKLSKAHPLFPQRKHDFEIGPEVPLFNEIFRITLSSPFSEFLFILGLCAFHSTLRLFFFLTLPLLHPVTPETKFYTLRGQDSVSHFFP